MMFLILEIAEDVALCLILMLDIFYVSTSIEQATEQQLPSPLNVALQDYDGIWYPFYTKCSSENHHQNA